MYQNKILICLVFALFIIFPLQSITADSPELPSLGLSSSYDISLNQEKLLGQGWLRQFRAQSKLYNDPLTQNYVEGLVRRLATWNRNLDMNDFDILLVDQRQLNAFAVPGGVVGVNTGLFTFAPYEDEFVSVLAHELAHISQRHFARRVQASQDIQWKTMAGLLAGILVASQGNADAGIAAIAGTQAAAIQSQLAWSRNYEQEADRIGMETLVAAGYASEAMPAMFAQMQRLTSLSGRPPEFLLTHPLTESRIADAQSRADQQAKQAVRVRGKDYEMLRARAIFHQYSNADDAFSLFSRQQGSEASLQYAHALKAKSNQNLKKYLELITDLANQDPDWLLVQFLQVEALTEVESWDEATSKLNDLLLFAPGYYPAQQLQVEIFSRQQAWGEARRSLQKLSQTRPNDPVVWFQLAEAAGKVDRQIQLHQARAEYFQLTGRFRQAFDQLDLALEQAKLQNRPWVVQSAIRERRRDLENLRSLMEI
ncbi:M48 family metalloprotease [Marinospirillum insulare]|uniref:Putative beta-barrel assembly-enhancing protease n=1 Tax=Marinospirillum insulare TaxID=217169 RepID=A0ABQ5ZU20_9GAMM|nr:M48 family metalloprotease [Marinospirillum insulare]GLR63624.1 putative beta-barrel assembly-enhancing protease [Marinospirillum insulare]